MERFEPYGLLKVKDNDILDNLLKEKLGKIVEPYLSDQGLKLEYLRPEDYLPDVGFQTVGNDGADHYRKLSDPGGYCLAWSLWYLESRIANPDLHPRKLALDLFPAIIGRKLQKKDRDEPELAFINYIRDYSHHLNQLRIRFLEDAGLPKMSHYNNAWKESHVETLSKSLVNKLNSIVKQRLSR